MTWYSNDYKVIKTQVFLTLPDKLRKVGIPSEWGRVNHQDSSIHSFIEGPCFDPDGNFYLVDIPFGRVFQVSTTGHWRTVVEYDGEPNGLAWHPDGKLVVADYKNGILSLDVASGYLSTILARRNTERFKGPNDLICTKNGDIYFTDQGQTGLHDPTGRVYRLHCDGRLDCLLNNGPSPNGLVLNLAEDVLFVAMTRDNSVWRLPLLPDGTTTKVGRFASFYGTAGPDGLAMDKEGNVLVAHASLGAVFVLSPRGECVARLDSCAGCATTNVTFGLAGASDIFITESSSGSILRAQWDGV